MYDNEIIIIEMIDYWLGVFPILINHFLSCPKNCTLTVRSSDTLQL